MSSEHLYANQPQQRSPISLRNQDQLFDDDPASYQAPTLPISHYNNTNNHNLNSASTLTLPLPAARHLSVSTAAASGLVASPSHYQHHLRLNPRANLSNYQHHPYRRSSSERASLPVANSLQQMYRLSMTQLNTQTPQPLVGSLQPQTNPPPPPPPSQPINSSFRQLNTYAKTEQPSSFVQPTQQSLSKHRQLDSTRLSTAALPTTTPTNTNNSTITATPNVANTTNTTNNIAPANTTISTTNFCVQPKEHHSSRSSSYDDQLHHAHHHHHQQHQHPHHLHSHQQHFVQPVAPRGLAPLATNDVSSSSLRRDTQRLSSMVAEPITLSSSRQSIDYYSVPVFIMETIILLAIGYVAYLLHFVHKFEPLISGFYCDDEAYMQTYQESAFFLGLHGYRDEPLFLGLILAVPIIMIAFCELINSMFGALKFRKIKALCGCCRLHSFTRRIIRFSGAYILGFLLVLITADVLATTTGRLRPFFKQECPMAYTKMCSSDFPTTPEPSSLSSSPPTYATDSPKLNVSAILTERPPAADVLAPIGLIMSAPTSSSINEATLPSIVEERKATSKDTQLPPQEALRAQEQTSSLVVNEHKWISLAGLDLKDLCGYENFTRHPLRQILARSWPSMPAALVSYACIYLSIYLAFVGTARPCRIITSVSIVAVMLASVVFNAELVKRHYNHWDDTLSSFILAFCVALFILHVYLNKFRDTHYYKNQKLFPKKQNSFPMTRLDQF